MLPKDPSYSAPRVGIGLRRAHFEALLTSMHKIDFLEVIPEQFMGVGGRARRVLEALRGSYPLYAHGVSLSVGGPDPFKPAAMEELSAFCSWLGTPFYSDHLCLSSCDGIETFDLLPLPFGEAAAQHVAARLNRATELLGLPIALENISYYARMPGSTCDEADFVTRVLDLTNAPLLLDVSNVLVNARNHSEDPSAALLRLPLQRTVAIHLAGHRFEPRYGLWLDDHASRVPDEALRLYEVALRQIGRPVPTTIEWDQQLPELEVVLEEAERARAVAHAVFAVPHAESRAC